MAGNHDQSIEAYGLPDGLRCHYLEDAGIELFGLQIWGTPWQPWFYDWALQRAAPRRRALPRRSSTRSRTTPNRRRTRPAARLRRPHQSTGRKHVGSTAMTATLERVKPQLMVCGHIHPGHGRYQLGETEIINAALVDNGDEPVNPLGRGRAVNVAEVVAARWWLSACATCSASSAAGTSSPRGLHAAGVTFHPARHEGGAICMADGYARVTGRSGSAATPGPRLHQRDHRASSRRRRRAPRCCCWPATRPPRRCARTSGIDQAAIADDVGAIAERVHSGRERRGRRRARAAPRAAERRPVVLEPADRPAGRAAGRAPAVAAAPRRAARPVAAARSPRRRAARRAPGGR